MPDELCPGEADASRRAQAGDRGRVRGGDRFNVTDDEFRAFYTAAFSRVVGQIYLLTGDLGEAQDAVQEAFIRGWDRRRRFASGDSPEGWIRTVAHRLAVSRWRAARSALAAWRRRGPAPDVAGPDVDTPLVISALRQIPDEQRRAIVLYHLCDLSVEQVATETGTPAGTVKARLSRGRAALRTVLGSLYDGDPSVEGPGGGSWAYAVGADAAQPRDTGRLRVGAWSADDPIRPGPRRELEGRDD